VSSFINTDTWPVDKDTGASDVVVVPLDGVATAAKWIEPCVTDLYRGLNIPCEAGDGSNDLKYASTREIGCRLRMEWNQYWELLGVHEIREASLLA
jgi:hypothetical protein